MLIMLFQRISYVSIDLLTQFLKKKRANLNSLYQTSEQVIKGKEAFRLYQSSVIIHASSTFFKVSL